MIYAVFSDIHSNIEAFDVVMKFYKDFGDVDSYLFCGDIVGYGPNPNECLEKIKKIKNFHMVLGNHDAALVGKKNITWFNEYARETILWTKKVITKENIDFINSVAETISMNDINLLHGSPMKPLDEYIFSSEQCLNNMEKFYTKICFCGHTHQPFIFEFDKNEKFKFIVPNFDKDKFEFKLSKQARYMVNVGSVGQPRDCNPKSCCVLYDDVDEKLFFQRLKYDIESTQKEMIKLGLPRFLAQRLSFGQ
ncbi:MAG: metallophosphoesterase family protein [Endomicrobiia bacterium]